MRYQVGWSAAFPEAFFRQHAFQARIVAFDRDHSVVYLADLRLPGPVLEIGPMRARWNPEGVQRFEFIRVFRIGSSVFAFASDQDCMMFLKGVGSI